MFKMKQILVVDDDPMAAEMVLAILEECGLEAHAVESGIEALEFCFNQSVPDLIISDMNMPLMTGLELFHALQEQGVNSPFVLLTGDDPSQYQSQAPGLAASLMKDADLFDRLIEVLEQMGPAS
jgi:CheY-like chemotaxis protein